MRNFDVFLDYCSENRNFRNSAYVDAFERIINHEAQNRAGHYMQLFYAIYDFLEFNDNFLNEITPPPYEISNDRIIYASWSEFIRQPDAYDVGYEFSSLTRNLDHNYAGDRVGGGGWSPIAKILFPVVALYLS